MRVVVTGGGTGGHVYPAVAVAHHLLREELGAAVLYIGGRSGPEADIVPMSGIEFRAVASRKLRQPLSLSTIPVLAALFRGYLQAGAILRGFRPDVVVSTGGYVAAATALAAARQRIPLVIQACDAVPGRTNLWISRWASAICVWFQETRAYFPPEKTLITGVPLRPDILRDVSRADARSALGLRPDLFTVLVLGGSQGARRLNELTLAMIGRLGMPTQVLHQTGPRHYEQVLRDSGGRGAPGVEYRPTPYIAEVAAAYCAAELVVCRCGIATLAEATACGLPALMVPLPTAYADHQTANARCVERAGAGILLPESGLTGTLLAEQAASLRDDAPARARMCAAARALARPHAAHSVAQAARERARPYGPRKVY